MITPSKSLKTKGCLRGFNENGIIEYLGARMKQGDVFETSQNSSTFFHYKSSSTMLSLLTFLSFPFIFAPDFRVVTSLLHTFLFYKMHRRQFRKTLELDIFSFTQLQLSDAQICISSKSTRPQRNSINLHTSLWCLFAETCVLLLPEDQKVG